MDFPFLQIFFNSLIIGGVYALTASGFSLIYATNRFMHFAHGVSIIVAGYSLFAFFSILKIPFAVSCVLTLLASGLIGFLMYVLVYQPLRKKNSSNVVMLMASIGLLILFENVTHAIFGPQVRTIGLLEVKPGLNIGNAVITSLQITIIACSLAVFSALYMFMQKTKIGRNLRAVSDNPQLASVAGLNVSSLMAGAFVLSSVLAGIAGILIGLEQNLSPSMGTDLIIKGFSGAVVGGLLSIPGAILGSYIVGFAENFGAWFLPSAYKDAIAFGLLFVFLLFRPWGIFGVDKGVKR